MGGDRGESERGYSEVEGQEIMGRVKGESGRSQGVLYFIISSAS